MNENQEQNQLEDLSAGATLPTPQKSKEQLEQEQAAKFAAIAAAFDNKVDVKEAVFFFKTVKQKDSEGKDTGVETKRPNIELGIPSPSFEGLIAILEHPGRGRDLVMEAVYNTVADQARAIINDDESITTDSFPYEKLGWDYIANLPKSERRGGGISQEVWKDFIADYINVMPAVTGKKVEVIQRAANIYAVKFNNVKSNKEVLAKLKGQLAIYLENTPNAETFAPCVEFLDKKADSLIKIDDSTLADAL